MGKGADIYSASKRVDDEFPYEPVGVFRLLKEIHRLDARLVPGADYDTAVIIRDLKDALDSPVLTVRQRQVVALYFFAQIGEVAAADLLNTAQPAVFRLIQDSVKRLAGALKNPRPPKYYRYKVKPFENRRPLFVWLNAVGSGAAPIYEVPREVMDDILLWMAENGEEKSQEVLRQRREGPPEVRTVYENPEDEYPVLTPRQMQYRNAKEVSTAEVKPKFDAAGWKKSQVKDQKTGEWIGHKKKIYTFLR